MAVRWVAHRGLSARAPENTLAAFRMALDAGADGVEFDVHFTADGVPVVIHDATVDRTTGGSGAVSALTLDELRRLDAGAWFDPAFAGERIPTLDETLELLADAPLIYPELKGHAGAAHIALFLETLARFGLEERTTVLAFDWGDLVAVRAGSRRVHLGFEVDRAELFDPALEAAAADGRASLSCAARVLLADPSLAARAEAAGVAVAAWTVNDGVTARALVEQGVQTLMGDDVGLRASVHG